MEGRKITVRELCRISIMAVIIALCAWISVPSAVPFTLQTFGVFCALLILGGRSGALSILIYILLGALGLPVFSSFRSGIPALTGPTGGYILGFLLMGLLFWALEKRLSAPMLLVIGNLVCYVFGTLWFCAVYSTPMSFYSAALICVVPFILPDALKLLLALAVSRRVKRALSLHEK